MLLVRIERKKRKKEKKQGRFVYVSNLPIYPFNTCSKLPFQLWLLFPASFLPEGFYISSLFLVLFRDAEREKQKEEKEEKKEDEEEEEEEEGGE